MLESKFMIAASRGGRQGVCLGVGGGGECLATAARGPKFCASPQKVAQRGGGGGLRHIFPDLKKKKSFNNPPPPGAATGCKVRFMK